MPNEAESIVSSARKIFNTGKTISYEFRLSQLKGLSRFINENEKEILEILLKENRKPKFEASITEVSHMKNEIQDAIKHLKSWMAPTRVKKPLPYIMDKIQTRPQPYGVVLIIGPWNYPFDLVISPLIGAIAAGNCVVVKPSEITPISSEFLKNTLPKYIDESCYYIFTGGIAETTKILEQKFDYIFYTGSTTVGKIIYSAAAKKLTPVTLELGGKSPVYLDDSADVELAATRILWGKCLNSGQSCLEPDYLLCSEFMRDKFIKEAKKKIEQWYGAKTKESRDYCRIINDNHFKRITKLLEGTTIALGGNTDPEDKYIEPTIVVNVKADDPIMQEEIFGPVLPIVTVETPEAAIEFINNREKPLAVYMFSTSKQEQEKFINGTYSGGICINDVLMHFSCNTLPFGGVGSSGIGKYHGVHSFETFSHQKATLIKSLDRLGEFTQSVRYPPYTENKLKIILTLTTKIPSISFCNHGLVLIFLLAAFVYYIYFRG
ncbi:aldehyde dehydrogenase, dimeric NADP-preferring-like isoform X2 [Sitophilus oryzae]|nr:aldehyde dehydrogenase, dimeric NADP-preferring-like isoform X2 [Sitophilus oryzae]XP_030751800.1 aldehyde dehydrogenase, dimeric NADP-preferring-like isoform X2 [Sitophilus oryzae]